MGSVWTAPSSGGLTQKIPHVCSAFRATHWQYNDSKQSKWRSHFSRERFSEEERHVLEKKDCRLRLFCCVLALEEIDGFKILLCLFNSTLVKSSTPNVFWKLWKIPYFCLYKGTWIGRNSIYISLAIIGVRQQSQYFSFLFIFYHDVFYQPKNPY